MWQPWFRSRTNQQPKTDLDTTYLHKMRRWEQNSKNKEPNKPKGKRAPHVQVVVKSRYSNMGFIHIVFQ